MPLLTDPTTISGCQLWLDATDITTLFQLSGTGGGTTQVTASGQPVGYWKDKSGQNRHFSAPNANRPTYDPVGINGKPGITTSGIGTGGTWLQSFSAVNATSQTIFMVLRWIAANPRGILYCQTSVIGADVVTPQVAGNWHGIQTGSGTNYYLRANNNDYSGINITSGVYKGHIIVAKCTGSSIIYYGDGGYNQATAGTIAPSVTYIQTRIGGVSPNESTAWWGNYCISEVIMYNRSLSFLEQKNIECYLGEKYNVSYSTYAIKDGNITDNSIYFNDTLPTSRPGNMYIYPNTYTLTVTSDSPKLCILSGNLDGQTSNGGTFLLAPTSGNVSLTASVLDPSGTTLKPLISISPTVTAEFIFDAGVTVQANKNPTGFTGGALISGVNCNININNTTFYPDNRTTVSALHSIVRGVSSTLRFTGCKFTGIGNLYSTILNQGTIIDSINSRVILNNCTMRYDDINDVAYAIGPTILLLNSTLTATNCPILKQSPNYVQNNSIGFQFNNSTGVFNNCNILGPVNYNFTYIDRSWSNTGPCAVLLANGSNVSTNGGTIIGAQQSQSTVGTVDGLCSNTAAIIVSDATSTLTVNNTYVKGGGPSVSNCSRLYAIYNVGTANFNSCTVEGGGGDGAGIYVTGTTNINNSNILGGTYDTAINNIGTTRFTNCNLIAAPDGVQPVKGSMLVTPGVNNYIRYASDGTGVGPSAYIYQYTADSLSAFNMPPISAVRAGVTYANATLMGTCIVPSPSSVALNIPVDNTVGTAVLSINDINSVFLTPLSSITAPGSIGSKIKTAATVESAGHLIASFTNG